jgi:TetR/AcrR family acrAB operon transcriptional repressor
MARRTKAEAAITREQLLDAAERVFTERGVSRASLAAIAAAAGVTRGALYWHFKDKPALFAALCERATLPLDAMLKAAAQSAADRPLEALRALMTATLRHLARDARAQRVSEILLCKTEACGDMGAVVERRQSARCACASGAEDFIRRAVQAGDLPSDTDAVLAAQYLQACMGGLIREWVHDRSAFDLGRSAPDLVDCLIGGLVARPPRRGARPRVRARHGVESSAASSRPSAT